jgi:hypothetical protein
MGGAILGGMSCLQEIGRFLSEEGLGGLKREIEYLEQASGERVIWQERSGSGVRTGCCLIRGRRSGWIHI